MKALLCGLCFDIRALEPTGKWTMCRCGNLEARWIDPQRGTVSVRAYDKSSARVIGFNNSFLTAAIQGPSHLDMVEAGGHWEAWRKLHDVATAAPGYIFDKSMRSCWACVVRVGETGDIKWEPEEKKPEEKKDETVT